MVNACQRKLKKLLRDKKKKNKRLKREHDNTTAAASDLPRDDNYGGHGQPVLQGHVFKESQEFYSPTSKSNPFASRFSTDVHKVVDDTTNVDTDASSNTHIGKKRKKRKKRRDSFGSFESTADVRPPEFEFVKPEPFTDDNWDASSASSLLPPPPLYHQRPSSSGTSKPASEDQHSSVSSPPLHLQKKASGTSRLPTLLPDDVQHTKAIAVDYDHQTDDITVDTDASSHQTEFPPKKKKNKKDKHSRRDSTEIQSKVDPPNFVVDDGHPVLQENVHTRDNTRPKTAVLDQLLSSTSSAAKPKPWTSLSFSPTKTRDDQKQEEITDASSDQITKKKKKKKRHRESTDDDHLMLQENVQSKVSPPHSSLEHLFLIPPTPSKLSTKPKSTLPSSSPTKVRNDQHTKAITVDHDHQTDDITVDTDASSGQITKKKKKNKKKRRNSSESFIISEQSDQVPFEDDDDQMMLQGHVHGHDDHDHHHEEEVNLLHHDYFNLNQSITSTTTSKKHLKSHQPSSPTKKDTITEVDHQSTVDMDASSNRTFQQKKKRTKTKKKRDRKRRDSELTTTDDDDQRSVMSSVVADDNWDASASASSLFATPLPLHHRQKIPSETSKPKSDDVQHSKATTADHDVDHDNQTDDFTMDTDASSHRTQLQQKKKKKTKTQKKRERRDSELTTDDDDRQSVMSSVVADDEDNSDASSAFSLFAPPPPLPPLSPLRHQRPTSSGTSKLPTPDDPDQHSSTVSSPSSSSCPPSPTPSTSGPSKSKSPVKVGLIRKINIKQIRERIRILSGTSGESSFSSEGEVDNDNTRNNDGNGVQGSSKWAYKLTIQDRNVQAFRLLDAPASDNNLEPSQPPQPLPPTPPEESPRYNLRKRTLSGTSIMSIDFINYQDGTPKRTRHRSSSSIRSSLDVDDEDSGLHVPKSGQPRRPRRSSSVDSDCDFDQVSIIDGREYRLAEKVDGEEADEEEPEPELRQGYAVSTKKKYFSVNRKDKILEVARDLFVGHKWGALKQLTHSFMVERRMPGFVIMGWFFTLLYAEGVPERGALKKFLRQFMRILDNPGQKYEFLLEIVMYMLRYHEELLAEKPFLIDLRTQMEKRSCKRPDAQTKCRDILRRTYQLYEEYLEFIEWRTGSNSTAQYITDSVQSFYNDTSYMTGVMKRLSERLKTNLTRLIEENEDIEMNLDMGVLMLLQLYDHDNELLEALEMLKMYADKNPDLLHAHIYLYEFLLKFPDIPNVEDGVRIEALKSIVRLCPDSRYTLRLVSELPTNSGLTTFERLEMLADFVDYVHNRTGKRAWKLMYRTVERSVQGPEVDDQERDNLKKFFGVRLRFWERIHFNLTELNGQMPMLRQFHRSSRAHSDSDYSTDVSGTGSESESSPASSTSRFPTGRSSLLSPRDDNSPRFGPNVVVAGKDYHLFVYKGRLLVHLAELGVGLSDNLEQYRRAIASL